jgi:hypothetical protein
LSYGLSEDELQQVFEEYGEVSSAKIITDKYSGKSKGFGFVECQMMKLPIRQLKHWMAQALVEETLM